ncbi:MAG: hypothetical protein HDQ93_02770 [Desulfovibrio sp.]|nr:hypothetical protein [Desulfovibrio sp.]
MSNVQFYKFSPAGNDTLFLVADLRGKISPLCKAALSVVGSEQAAVVDLDKRVVRMAGDEFCVNAARAFAALLDYVGEAPEEDRDDAKIYSASMSGYDGPLALSVRGAVPDWVASVAFRPRAAIIERGEGSLADLPGISHFLIETREFPAQARAREQAFAIADELKFASRPAWGVSWLREKDGLCEIMPFVVCPGAGTQVFETSCGSASLALALTLKREKTRVLQPSGDILDVTLSDDGMAIVEGPVALKATGLAYL